MATPDGWTLDHAWMREVRPVSTHACPHCDEPCDCGAPHRGVCALCRACAQMYAQVAREIEQDR